VGSVTVTGPETLRAVRIEPARVPSLIDEIPAWTIAAAAAEGTSVLSGAAELRVKESDRIATLARNLAALGIAVEERRDGLAITGGTVRAGTVEAEQDHRIAMAFAVLAARADGDVRIRGAGGIVTSFPDFLGTLAGLGGRVEAGGVAA
jgi:3-phosphoshikimate 1-carboxyvinyltransferase